MKYVYCEFPAMGNPIEREMSKEKAIKRYNLKVKALKDSNSILSLSWFVGVQIVDGDKKEWLLTNE